MKTTIQPLPYPPPTHVARPSLPVCMVCMYVCMSGPLCCVRWGRAVSDGNRRAGHHRTTRVRVFLCVTRPYMRPAALNPLNIADSLVAF